MALPIAASPQAPRDWMLVDAETVARLEARAVTHGRIPVDLLMEAAARSAAQVVLEELPPGGEVLVVCGAGNNGGDGFAAARWLAQAGAPVRIALGVGAAPRRGPAAENLRRARALGLEVLGADWRAPRRGVIVDALFGTGLTRPLQGPAAASVRRIARGRSAELRVVSLDLPSGIGAGDGRVLGVAVPADRTVCFGPVKLGLALEPGRSHAGRIAVARIGIPEPAQGAAGCAELWTRASAGGRLPARPAEGHKGSFGHVLLVAGSEGKTGAAALAAEAAGRAGAGLVTLACAAGLNAILETKCTEAMTVALGAPDARRLEAASAADLLALARERDVVGIGPGLGRAESTQRLVREFALATRRPLLLDADALFAFRGQSERLRTRRAPTLLTPHPGEAAVLLGVSRSEVQRDRCAAARELARRSKAVVLLKGAATLCAGPDGRLVVNPTGGPALASGGTGDVLLGVAAGFVAQGLPPLDAGALAAFVHGAAGDRIARASGSAGLLAGDLLPELPRVLAELRQAAVGESPGVGLQFPFPER